MVAGRGGVGGGRNPAGTRLRGAGEDEGKGEDAGVACGLVVLAGVEGSRESGEAEVAAPPPVVLAVAYRAGCVDIALVPAGISPRWVRRVLLWGGEVWFGPAAWGRVGCVWSAWLLCVLCACLGWVWLCKRGAGRGVCVCACVCAMLECELVCACVCCMRFCVSSLGARVKRQENVDRGGLRQS